MIEERYGGGGGATPQQGLLLLVLVGLMFLSPYIIGDHGQAMFDAVVELLSPASLLILTVFLLLTIQLSSSRRAQFSSGYGPHGEPDPLEQYFGGSPSPIGVALVLILVLFLLQNKISLFIGSEEDGGDE